MNIITDKIKLNFHIFKLKFFNFIDKLALIIELYIIHIPIITLKTDPIVQLCAIVTIPIITASMP